MNNGSFCMKLALPYFEYRYVVQFLRRGEGAGVTQRCAELCGDSQRFCHKDPETRRQSMVYNNGRHFFVFLCALVPLWQKTPCPCVSVVTHSIQLPNHLPRNPKLNLSLSII